MSREWFAVYGRLLRTPKFRRLSSDAQLSLVYVWALAGDETPEATWGSAEALRDLLEYHGRPPGSVDELVAARWLDVDDAGRVSVHDWDAWQWSASAKARAAWQAAYMRDWRAERKKVPAPPKDTTGTPIPDTNKTESLTRKPRVDNRPTVVVDNGVERPSFEGRGTSSPSAMPDFCLACGTSTRGAGPTRVTQYRGRAQEVHEACLPVTVAQ